MRAGGRPDPQLAGFFFSTLTPAPLPRATVDQPEPLFHLPELRREDGVEIEGLAVAIGPGHGVIPANALAPTPCRLCSSRSRSGPSGVPSVDVWPAAGW